MEEDKASLTRQRVELVEKPTGGAMKQKFKLECQLAALEAA